MATRPRLSPLLTVREAAAYLRRDRETVYGYIREGLLPAVHPPRPGMRGMRIRPADLEAFVGAPLEVRR